MATATLLLRLVAPMQSWGTTSRFDERDSQLEPSKSGVIGLICAALGRERNEEIDDLAALKMGVRVDQEGVLMRDYQTATGVMRATGRADLKRTVVSPRYYLADAAFLVGLEGDSVLLQTVDSALHSPHWSLSLGRKSFPPSQPIWLEQSLHEHDLSTALMGYPPIIQIKQSKTVRLLLEHSEHGVVRLDQPVAPFSERLFGPRYIATKMVNLEANGCI
ncbi:type I-E CRISPR-associated protein Cas5/CasD [Ectothiorhodospiraceae bacterium BW-2]|nr:type I-E CRISPR-associated protein Cas5/CasD [Ectothiorhodospiraceae bacterium BW-2]